MSNHPKQELLDLMKAIAESGYHASWMEGSHEHKLWSAILNGPMPYGQTGIDEHTIKRLKYLSRRARGWWIYDQQKRELTFLPLRVWKKRYSPEIASYQLAEVFDDLTGTIFSQKRSYFIFDSNCPICAHTLRAVRAKNHRPDIVLIDIARQSDHPIRTLLSMKNVPPNRGTIIFHKRKIYYADSTINILTEHGHSDWTLFRPFKSALRINLLCHRAFPKLHKQKPW